jgi:hypothetical protein
MMIFTHQKSKKKNPTQKQKAEYQAWLDSVNNMSGISGRKYGGAKVVKSATVDPLTTPAGRVTPKYSSLVTPGGACTKPVHGKVYTGTAMKGIGTLHKSNAVPIFSDQEAKDQALMRR